MIFVDTGAWFAVAVRNDPDHAVAMRWLARNREPLVTTDYVLAETAWRNGDKARLVVDHPKTGKIAIKVINHYGDEVLKVYEV